MSVVSADQISNHAERRSRNIELPASIQNKLQLVIRQNRRAELLRQVAVFAAVGLLLILTLVVIDLLIGMSWTPARWAVWIAVLSCAGSAIRYSVVRARRQTERLLDAAWKIESAHPDMEERLTSTVQFLDGDSSQLQTSPQLLEALVSETDAGVSEIDPESIPKHSSLLPFCMASLLATILVFSTVLWPRSVLTSLDNLATPWSTYALPMLSAEVLPGDIAVAEGQSVDIQVIAEDALADPMLEILREEGMESHEMITTDRQSTFTLMNLTDDTSYRVRSGGLFSALYTITVHPRPKLRSVSAHLSFPEYTQLEPLALEQVTAPMQVPTGTEVTLTAVSDSIGVAGAIRWTGESKELGANGSSNDVAGDAVRFEWKFTVEPEMKRVGLLAVSSEHGVRSEPQPIEIQALADTTPGIEIVTPSLWQLTMSRDNVLPIEYRVSDDYGVSKTELMVKFADQEPTMRPCPMPLPDREQRVWNGATSLDLSEVPGEHEELTLWLRIADNRPDAYGGAQMVESRGIQITLADGADSLGAQQIQAEREMIEQSLDQAIEQVQAAKEAAEALLSDQAEQDNLAGETDEGNQGNAEDPFLTEEEKKRADDAVPETDPRSADEAKKEQVDALREQAQQAKQTLNELSEKLREGPKLFQPKSEEIQQIADQEVAEALEQANQIPLSDDQQQQNEHARTAEEELSSAIEQLDQLKAEVAQQADDMEKAAHLDELASKQDQLAREAADGLPEEMPDEKWRDRQEAVAEDLQSMVQADEKSRREQLLERADEAQHLAEEAQRLAQQQRKLGQAMQEAQSAEGQHAEAKKQMQDVIAAEQDAMNRRAEQAANPASKQEPSRAPPQDQNARQKPQQERLEQAAQAAREGLLDQAAARLQEQMAERAEQIQKQAEQLAQQKIPDPKAQQNTEQAARQLEQATEKAAQAEQAMEQNPTKGLQSDTAENLEGIKQDQDAAANQLDQAANSLEQACQACRQSAGGEQPSDSKNTNAQQAAKPQQNEQPGQSQEEPEGSKQGAEAEDGANQPRAEQDGKSSSEQEMQPEEREQLLQRAGRAEQLAEQAQQLAQQQKQLGEAVEKAEQQPEQADEVKQQLQELIEEQKREIEQQGQEPGPPQNGENEQVDQEAKQKQRLEEAAKAAEEGDLDQAAAKLQEQIAEKAERIQQQAEELANEEHADEPTRERAKQAAEEMQQAKQQADQAKQSACEKCKGGGQGQSGKPSQGQSKTGKQGKPVRNSRPASSSIRDNSKGSNRDNSNNPASKRSKAGNNRGSHSQATSNPKLEADSSNKVNNKVSNRLTSSNVSSRMRRKHCRKPPSPSTKFVNRAANVRIATSLDLPVAQSLEPSPDPKAEVPGAGGHKGAIRRRKQSSWQRQATVRNKPPSRLQ